MTHLFLTFVRKVVTFSPFDEHHFRKKQTEVTDSEVQEDDTDVSNITYTLISNSNIFDSICVCWCIRVKVSLSVTSRRSLTKNQVAIGPYPMGHNARFWYRADGKSTEANWSVKIFCFPLCDLLGRWLILWDWWLRWNILMCDVHGQEGGGKVSQSNRNARAHTILCNILLKEEKLANVFYTQTWQGRVTLSFPVWSVKRCGQSKCYSLFHTVPHWWLQYTCKQGNPSLIRSRLRRCCPRLRFLLPFHFIIIDAMGVPLEVSVWWIVASCGDSGRTVRWNVSPSCSMQYVCFS